MKKIYDKYKIYIKYLASSGISFVVDIILFTIFFHLFDKKIASAIIIASYLARALSSLVNYLLNKFLVFEAGKKDKSTLYQYYALVVMNITVSGLLVSFLNTILPLKPTFIKIFIDSLIFVFDFFIQRFIIFNKQDKEYKWIKYLLPLLTFIVFFIHYNDSKILFNYHLHDYIEMLVILPLLYWLYLKVFPKYKDNYKLLNILAILLSISMIIGYSYANVGSASLLINKNFHILITLFKFICFYFLFKNVFNSLYKYLTEANFRNKHQKFYKHPFRNTIIILGIIYGLYLLFFYPGVINWDNANQIKEVLGIHTRYLDSLVNYNPNIYLTNFNPILHTLLLGNLFKVGLLLNNVNFGIFLYTLLQMIVYILVLAYTIYFLKKEGVKGSFVYMVLLLYALVPFFAFYSITAVKDTYFSLFYVLYIIELYRFIKYDFKLKDYLIFIIVMLLLILFRNNGIYIIVLSLPFVCFAKKKIWKTIIVLSIGICVFYVGFNKSLSYFGVYGTSIREALSVPFQQTARYVKYYEEDVTPKEKEAIDKLLEYDTIANRYDPQLSDKVKNKFNRYYTKDDLKEYFKVWFKMFFKHPGVYIEATINNTYGYFYPNTYKWYFYYKINPKLQEAGYDYHYNKLEYGRNTLAGYAGSFKLIPIIKLLVNCAFYTWSYLFLLIMLILKKKKEYIPLLFPAFSLVLMNVVGPANTYFRYVLPYAMSLPLIIGLLLNEINPKFKLTNKKINSKKN